MRNEQVLSNFVNGATSGRSSNGNLYIDGNKLINYHTCIAERFPLGIVVNTTKYSTTTSKIQNKLISLVPAKNLVTVNGINIGARQIPTKALEGKAV